MIRSAYGISYVHFNRLGGENLLAYNGPYIVDAQITRTSRTCRCAPRASADPVTCFRPTQMGYPQNFAVPANFNPLRAQARYIPKDNPTGYIQSWHFTVQREIAKNLVLDVAYVGNRGTHLMILADWNQARPNSSIARTCRCRRAVRSRTSAAIEIAYGAGYSNYNALQVKLEKRYSAGLTFINSFTWSKGIDNASGHLEVQERRQLARQHPRPARMRRASPATTSRSTTRSPASTPCRSAAASSSARAGTGCVDARAGRMAADADQYR